jgi:hypothetical protein
MLLEKRAQSLHGRSGSQVEIKKLHTPSVLAEVGDGAASHAGQARGAKF